MLLTFGDFELDRERRQLLRAGEVVPLEPKAYELLCLLVDRRPRALSRAQIRDVIWPGTFISESTLGVVVNNVRQALDDDARQPRFVRTVHGFGYAFCGDARETPPRETDGAPKATAAPGRGAAGDSPAADPTGVPARSVGTGAGRRVLPWLALGTVVLTAMAVGALALVRATPPAVPKITHYQQITSDRVEKFGPWFEGRVLSDGARLYYNDFGNNSFVRLAYVAASGGEVLSLPMPFPHQPLLMDISRDGADLLVVMLDVGWGKPGALWIFPTVGGTPRRVGDLRANSAAWSPTGERIAVTRGADLFFAKADGSDERKAWTAGALLHSPAWSPDGTRVRLTVKERSVLRRSELWEYMVDTGEARRVLPGFDRSSCCGQWTPDGETYVFEAGNRRGDLWAVTETNGWLFRRRAAPVQLTEGVMQFFAPAPGRDGPTLFAVGWKPQGELVRYDAASRLWVPFLGGLSAHEVDFSRDGRWIVYTTYPEGSLWRSRVDGSQKLQLTFPPVTATLPRLSPDASQVAFTALGPGREGVHLVSAAGGAAHKLPVDGLEASWSPDGRTLAVGMVGTSTAVRIRVLDLATNEVMDLPGSDDFNSPRWSPDGRSLVALSADASRLMLHDLASGRWRVLRSGHPNGNAWPNWSRDGRHVFVATSEGLTRIRTSDGAVEVVHDSKELQAALYHFGSWTGVTPDGTAIALRNASVNEMFALTWERP